MLYTPPALKKRDYKKYIRSEKWKEKATKLKDSVGCKCEICSSIERLCVHHNTYITYPNEDHTDLIVLCRECHYEFHQRNGNYLTGVAGVCNPQKCSTCSNAFLLNESKKSVSLERKLFLCSSCMRLYKHKLTREFYDGLASKTEKLITTNNQLPSKPIVASPPPCISSKKQKKRKKGPKYRPKAEIDPNFRPVPPKYNNKIDVERVSRPKGYKRSR
mgnify:CR=1 FL=1